jgi:signal-transduction protein with cAMP-binding, CBS, and nucleotidyltransferase domain
LERLNGLTAAGVFDRETADSVREAYEALMGFRLRANLRAIQEGRPVTSHLDPERLPKWDQQRLRDAFGVAESLQKRVRDDFWWIK